MRRILCVAEKNDVAKGVSNILGRGNVMRREGRSKYNKIYQVEMDVFGQRSLLAITSVSGHLLNLAFGPEMKTWTNVPIGLLFDVPVNWGVIDGMEPIQRTLKEEAARSDMLIVFTDCDREGEAIGAEIVRTCSEAKRLDVYRARFSEITPRAIQTAMNNLIRLDNRQVDAVECRSELDLRIGAAFTRLQTLHLRSQCAQAITHDTLISYGSCQFPTLGFVVERFKAIQAFIPETFWKIVVEHTRNGSQVEFNWERHRLFDRDVVEALYDDCMDARSARVTKIAKKPKSRWRPQPLDTVELEKLAVRKLKMTAKTALAVAEKLYMKGYISYPRTETNKFPPDIHLDQLAQMQTMSADWGQFATEIVDKGPDPRNGTKTDEAHPPIHPLKFAARNQLDANEWRLYELVVRHFLACVSWDARGQETKVELQCADEKFYATGLQIEDLGYMKVYPYEKWSDKTLPLYREGEILNDHRLRLSDSQTQPPLLLNEADLIALMDKFGIGTDATHADHIEKIKDRQYVGVQADGRFFPGFLGLALVDGYDDMGFAMSKPHMRADLERQLQAICAGTRRKQEVLGEQKEKYKRIFGEAEIQVTKLSDALKRYLRDNPNTPLLPVNAAPQQPPGPPGGGGGGAGRGRGRGRPPRQPEVSRIESDEIPPNARGRGRGRDPVTIRGARGGRGGTERGPDSTLAADGKKCLCGGAARVRTVNKEGPNKGRQFLGCSKDFGDVTRCNFFEWVQ